MSTTALIIFAKNPIEGKVKTRLSSTLGTVPTLRFYEKLLKLTKQTTEKTSIQKFIFYSDYIDHDDQFTSKHFAKKLQLQVDDLGVRMINAFHYVLQLGFSKCLIIGTDCPYLTSKQLEDSVCILDKSDVVIGPAVDGGFYLLGLKHIENLLFDNIQWSTNNVCSQLIKNLETNKRTISLLDYLEDIDDLESYNRYINFLKSYE